MTAIIERTDLELIDTLDFDPPCEHSQHAVSKGHHGPAWALIALMPCPTCGDGAGISFLLCRRAWDAAERFGLWCSACKAGMSREQGWRFVALVRP